jgi:urea transport system substrate-binding protein
MSKTAPACPSEEQLADLLANALPAAAAEELRQHIVACPSCRNRLSGSDTQAGAGINLAGPSSETRLFVAAEAAAKSNPSFEFLRPPVNADELGRLGDYRVLRRIGRGGMGIVFEAEDVGLARRVALKVLRPDLADSEYRARFLREARAAASLHQDHIVTIYQVGEDNGVPFLAMEFLRGESLETRLGRDRWLPVADALNIARQAAEGLAVAHETGLIHRDVKPDNLWLEAGSSGPAIRVKLLDFGLARPSHGPSELTAPGQIVGTPGYMAPETVYGLPADGRADLYALGCVIYRMLTGKTPFADQADTRAMLRAAAETDLPPVDAVAPGIPKPVAVLLRDLLARDPGDRPPDARSVILRIEEIERGTPGDAKPVPANREPDQKPDRVRIGRWAGGAALVGVACVIGYIVVQRKVLPVLSAPAAAAAPETISVGLVYSMTGSLAYSEEPVRQATLQAISEINEAGGVLGKRIKPIMEDGGSDEEMFARAAEKLIENGAVTLFGCWSASSRKRVEEVCLQHDRLLVYAVPDEGLADSPNVFYLGGTPNQLMIPAVRWVYSELHKKRYFLAGSEDVFSRATHVILRHEIDQLGGTVVGEAYRPPGALDFAEVAAEIERSGADVILCTIDGLSNVAFASALRGRGIRPAQVPTVWFNVGENELRFVSDAKTQMVDDYAPFCYFQSLDLPANRAFLKRFRADSENPTLAVTDPMEASYSSVYLWKQAVVAAGMTETGPLREAFCQQSFDAPEGKIRVDAPTRRAWRTPRLGRINPKLDFDVVWAATEPRAPVAFPTFKTRAEWDQLLQELYKRWDGHWQMRPR